MPISKHYFLSSPFHYQSSLSSSSPSQVTHPPTVSPSGAHIAYFKDNHLIVRQTCSTNSYSGTRRPPASSASTKSLFTKKQNHDPKLGPHPIAMEIVGSIDFSAIFEASPYSIDTNTVLMEWDSCYVYKSDPKVATHKHILIQDNLAVSIGLTVYLFNFTFVNNENSSSSFKWDSIKCLPDTVLRFPAGIFYRTNSLKAYTDSDPPSIFICGLQWLQGYSGKETNDKVVRICLYLGNRIGKGEKSNNNNDNDNLPISAAVCSTDGIELLIPSPKPGFRIEQIPPRVGIYNEDGKTKDADLYGIVVREFSNDYYLIFSLKPEILSKIPLSESSSSSNTQLQNKSKIRNSDNDTSRTATPWQQPILDLQKVIISPCGLWLATMDTKSMGYSVSIHSLLGNRETLVHTYHGPYIDDNNEINCIPSTHIIWTELTFLESGDLNEYPGRADLSGISKQLLLIGDSKGLVTVLDPVCGKPLLTLAHGSGLILTGTREELKKRKSNKTELFDHDDGGRNLNSFSSSSFSDKRSFKNRNNYQQESSDNNTTHISSSTTSNIDNNIQKNYNIEEEEEELTIWKESLNKQFNVLEYSSTTFPFDPPLVDNNTNNNDDNYTGSIKFLKAWGPYVATVISTLPSTVFLWKLQDLFINIESELNKQGNNLDTNDVSSSSLYEPKSKLISTFYHSSYITNIEFRQNEQQKYSILNPRFHETTINTPTTTTINTINKTKHGTAAQLLVTTEYGHVVGIWDSRKDQVKNSQKLINQTPDLIEFGQLQSLDSSSSSSSSSSFSSNDLQKESKFFTSWVNNLDPNIVTILAWNNFAFCLFHKTITFDDNDDDNNDSKKLNNDDNNKKKKEKEEIIKDSRIDQFQIPFSFDYNYYYNNDDNKNIDQIKNQLENIDLDEDDESLLNSFENDNDTFLFKKIKK